MSGTMMPTMCQVLVVTQLNFKKRFKNCLRCCTGTANHSRDTATGFADVQVLQCDHAQAAGVWKTDAVNR